MTDPNACSHCGGKISSYPMGGCPGCGAPNCCQRCCDEANQPEETPAKVAPRHPSLPHLTHLAYFFIGGGQPRGRTELYQQPKGPSIMEQAAKVVVDALKRAQSAANTALVETLSQ